MPRHPTRFRGTPAELTNHSPGLGEHTDEILADLGRADDVIRLRESGVVA
jgi:crotonobetainyl-CoA:carnitine CoA-transferase CaiB-like acyl-CoA transferase